MSNDHHQPPTHSQLLGRVLGPRGLALHPAPGALVRIAGPDAADFLQRMCSQDLLAMVPGQARPAAFLTGKGRLSFTCVAARLDEAIYLSTQAGSGAGLCELLERYHFAEKLEVEGPLPLACGVTRRPLGAARAGEDGAAPSPGRAVGLADGGIAIGLARHGLHTALYHAPAAWFADEPSWNPDRLARLDPAGTAATALRIVAGEPLVGTDTDERTLALEAGIEDHISFTKGCYTGQEIVARIRTYGHTNRALCLLLIEGGDELPVGTLVCETAEGDAVGRLMSSAPLPGGDRQVAFGYLPVAFLEGGTALTIGGREGPAATVVAFPGPAPGSAEPG